MTQALIRKAFETRLKTWADANGLSVAWENVAFDPPDAAYARAHLIPAPTDDLFLDLTGRDYYGIFQVSLHMPRGTGPGATDALVASLDAAFTPGSFTQDTIIVALSAPMSAAPAIPAADRYVVPVSAAYRVVTA